MAEMPYILKKKIFFKKYILGKLLNISELSWVYEGKNLEKNTPVAIKIENTNKCNLLESETYILMNIKGFGIPKVISFGRFGYFRILIEELLGKDLHTIWESGPFKTDPLGKKNTYIKDICLIAIQGIERLKHIHDKNVIHKDIKTKNFLIGLKDPNVIYLIDFGFSKKYRSSRTGKHIKFSNLKYLTGSLAFASCNVIKGYESSRRDDLESFGYMLIYLAKGGWTPWKKYSKINQIRKEIEIISKMKLEISEENMCEGLPNEFIHYLKYVKKLDFEQKPDYQYLINLFKSILLKNEKIKNSTFFWIKQKSQKRKKQIFKTEENKNKVIALYTINNSRSNSHKRLYNKIKDSLNKNSPEKKNPIIYFSRNRIINSEKKNNFLNIKLESTNINTNSLKNTIDNYKAFTETSLRNNIKNKVYNKLPSSFIIQRNKKNEMLNLINGSKTLFQNYNFNKKRNINHLKTMNSTFNRNNGILLYNNINCNKIFFIKKNPNITKINSTNNSRLNIRINKNKIITPNFSVNDLNLKGNIIYKSIFKKI